MMRTRAILMLMATTVLSSALVAQEPPAAGAKPEVVTAARPATGRQYRLISTKIVEVDLLAKRFQDAFNVAAQALPSFPALLVSGSEDQVREVEAIVRALERSQTAKPRPPEERTWNVELTFWMLMGGPQATPAAKVPAGMEPVIAQLRAAFPFEQYTVLDTMYMRSRSGQQVEHASVVSWPHLPTNAPPTYSQLKYTARVTDEGRLVNLNGLRFGGQLPVATGVSSGANTPWQTYNFGMNTELDVRDGQRVVVGKANAAGGMGVFLVVSSRVLPQ